MAYRRLNPRARLLGIEHNRLRPDWPRSDFDQVAVVDVEQDPVPFALDRPIDCIGARRRDRAPPGSMGWCCAGTPRC